MEGLERVFKITNYYDHPESPRHIVFHYFKKEQAGEFERLLKEGNIEFEKHVEEEGRTIYLFGVHKKFEKEAVRMNFLAIGRNRQPFISDPLLRWLALIVFFLALALAIIGFYKAQ